MPNIGPTIGERVASGLFGWSVTSNDMNVKVVPEYLPERSSPAQSYYAFSYHVTITNLGPEPVQLLRRQWTITDGRGAVDIVEGEGVVGVQPWIKPGESYEYQSGCPLRTPQGYMRGWYFYETQKGLAFRSRIPAIFLRHDKFRH
jgi:ApaG protein